MYRYRSSQKTSPSFKQLRCLLCFLSMVVFKPNEFTPKNNSFFVLILKVSVLFRNRVTCMCFKTDTHTPTCYSKSMDKYLSKVNLQSKFQTIQRLNVWSKQNIKLRKVIVIVLKLLPGETSIKCQKCIAFIIYIFTIVLLFYHQNIILDFLTDVLWFWIII